MKFACISPDLVNSADTDPVKKQDPPRSSSDLTIDDVVVIFVNLSLGVRDIGVMVRQLVTGVCSRPERTQKSPHVRVRHDQISFSDLSFLLLANDRKELNCA